MTIRAVGIDLGTRALDAVVLEGSEPFRVADVTILLTTEIDRLIALCEGAASVAIDAPAALSLGLHAKDAGISVGFRTARCGEIALHEQHRKVVRFRTPIDEADAGGWMRTGFRTWAHLLDAGHSPIEVYPAAAFELLSEGPLGAKKSVQGREKRLGILRTHLDLPATAETWNDDTLDAAIAALVAAWSVTGERAVAAAHDHDGSDGSAIWVPRPR